MALTSIPGPVTDLAAALAASLSAGQGGRESLG
jgi:hypothetical protein